MKKTLIVLTTLIVTMLATTMVAFAGSATLKQDANGTWWYYNNDVLDTTKTGMVDYNGGLFVVINGVVRADFMGMCHVEFPDVDAWYFFSQGQVQQATTGFAEYNGAWFYLNKGMLDSSKTGIYTYDGARFLVAEGRLVKEYKGLYQHTEGPGADNKWYFFADGQLQEQYTGLAQYDGEWFYLQNGCLAEDYTGNVEYDGATFYVVNGMIKSSGAGTTQPETPANPYEGMIATYRYYGMIQDGQWYFHGYSEDETKPNSHFSYNIAGDSVKTYLGTGYPNPALIHNDTMITETGLMNLKTGKEIFTLKENQHWVTNTGHLSGVDIIGRDLIADIKAQVGEYSGPYCSWNEGNTVLVYEVKESFTGNTYSLGILNDKGEWVMPMTSGFPWDAKGDSLRYSYLGDTYYLIGAGNTLYVLNSADKSVQSEWPAEFTVIDYMDGKIFGKVTWRNFGLYDIKTGEYTTIAQADAPHTIPWDDSFWANCGYVNDNYFWYKLGGVVYGADANNKVCVTFDVSSYADVVVRAVSKDYICFTCNNGSGTDYMCFMKADGTMVFEPQKIGAYFPFELSGINSHEGKVIIDDGKLICFRNDNQKESQLFVYDVKTKTQTIIEAEEYKVWDYDTETNTFIVGTTYAEEWASYLVNVNKLHTLIDPFK